ncbi:MAG: hypothetical protein M9924_19755 [Rhizobiaceae bacterium]|nr:hypothetical protein [Rhizobiaceae bacterium]
MDRTSHLKLLTDNDQGTAPGLVWAFRGGVPSQAAKRLTAEEIPAALAERQGWVWLHVDLVDQRIHGWLETMCALPKASCAVLEGHDQGFLLDHEDGVVHGIAPELHGEMEKTSSTIGHLHFAVTEHLLVTGRRHTLASVKEVQSALAAGKLRPGSAFDLFEAIIAAFGRNAGRRLAEAAAQLDEVEDHLVMERLADERRILKQVRRLSVSLHRPISALAALFRDQDPDGELSEEAQDMLRRLAGRLDQLDLEVMSVNDRARLLQEELSAELADESNRSLRALAVMSAFLLPGTLVVGIFGMNTAGLPFTETGSGSLLAVLLGVGATALFYWFLRWAGVKLRL